MRKKADKNIRRQLKLLASIAIFVSRRQINQISETCHDLHENNNNNNNNNDDDKKSKKNHRHVDCVRIKNNVCHF